MPEWKAEAIDRVANNKTTHDDLKMLWASGLGDDILQYNLFLYEKFGLGAGYNRFPTGSNFGPESKYTTQLLTAMQDTVNSVCADLIDEINSAHVPGSIVEFGVASGSWIKRVHAHLNQTNQIRDIYGFDSFEGLPDSNKDHDEAHWSKGQFAYSLEHVSSNLEVDKNPNITLVRGWFSDTLPKPIAQSIKEIAFAKVDCDLYDPSVECLEYLRGRLSDGAILHFDDWAFSSNIGESKAFMEWFPTVPEYSFELIGFINWRLFMRVKHTKVSRQGS